MKRQMPLYVKSKNPRSKLQKEPIMVQLREDFKKDWVKALRSGRYDQCTGQLVDRCGDDYSFCCLGVACDRLMHQGVELHYTEEFGIGTYGGASQLPPRAALLHIFEGAPGHKQAFNKLKPEDLILGHEGEDPDTNSKCIWDYAEVEIFHDDGSSTQQQLFQHNDSGATFEQIAQAIEEQL